jgi:hypothetical protein
LYHGLLEKKKKDKKRLNAGPSWNNKKNDIVYSSLDGRHIIIGRKGIRNKI